MSRFIKQIILVVIQLAFVLVMGQAFAVNGSYKANASGSGYNAPYFEQQIDTTRPSLPAFSSIDAKGDYQIIVSGGKSQSIVLIGHPLALQRVDAHVSGNTLVLRQIVARNESYTYNTRILVRITTPFPISSISLGGKSQLQARGIQTSNLTVSTYDSSSVYLRGKMNVQRIQNNSSGMINLGGVYARNLIIAGSGSGVIRVMGSGNILSAHLKDSACLEAEFFKAKSVYVETEDAAIAKVQPVDALYAFAKGYSNIYYYRVPSQISGYSKSSGNVLKVESWG